MAVKKVNAKPIKKVRKTASRNSFPIVAIGASAGGLEAMMELLKHLPSNTGMSFIYVQHLSPDHKSMLSDILSKKTKMKVQEIDDMDKIEPNNVFIIPYNKGIEVTDGHIKLIPRSVSSNAISIDILFSSLAHAQKERVIGIVLSGSASDGTIGIKDIKHQGGLTFAQNDSAKFTSMPHSAIATGAVDYILSPKEIALELARLSKHPFVQSTKNGLKTNNDDLIENGNPYLKDILNQVYTSTGVDFHLYKMSTIKRRIIRRMLLYKIATLKQYAKLLTQKKEELDILYQDLLINVTSFFRDTDTHKYLKETLLPKLLKRKKTGEALRIWVPACATGEEAYSIAMLLLEIKDKIPTNTSIQIFATDLSEKSIATARVGVYSKQELESVTAKRIQRFFTKVDGGYRVNKALRDMCVFAPHNILSDPPFSRLDFISCCNLFIYLDNAAQKKTINTFHYALNNDGFLMLGKSENITQSSSLFKSSNSMFKIFSRKANSGTQRFAETTNRIAQHHMTKKIVPKAIQNKSSLPLEIRSSTQHSLDHAIDDMLVAEFLPASVVINYQMEIIQFRGTTDLYLTHPKGRASFNILKMARPEIAFELRNSISKVIRSNSRIKKSGIEFKINSMVKSISIEIVPLTIEWSEPLILIVFNEHEQAETYNNILDNGKGNSVAKDRRIAKLEQELATAHADALTLAQYHETFTEELQSAHEEVVSSNEDLQTVNEELETSKEEIESANEELTTTNQELQTRNDLLTESYKYSEAIVSTMHEPMLVLGKDFRVISANKAFYQKFGVSEEQTIGVLLYELGNRQWNIPALRELLEDIIPKNSQFYNYEVRHSFQNLGEKIMSLNASRVIQNAHREQLILLVIADITVVTNLKLEKERIEKALLAKEKSERKVEKLKLEKAVIARTKELKEANELLENKNNELLTMNIELESFTYVSSHDLQEPLRKLRTFAGIILEKENNNLSDKGKNYFQLIQQSAERMQQLIHDLLTFSLIRAAEREFKKMDLSIIIENVKKEFKDEIAEKHALIEVKEICEVNVIPFQLKQLIQNIIGNSLKFCKPQLPPHIVISSRNLNVGKTDVKGLIKNKEYCQITISDNGIGFDNEFKEKIFEVFQKLHAKEEYAGTGIGLAIVKKIVDNHHGIITASSQVNKGSTFDIYIPVNQ